MSPPSKWLIMHELYANYLTHSDRCAIYNHWSNADYETIDQEMWFSYNYNKHEKMTN